MDNETLNKIKDVVTNLVTVYGLRLLAAAAIFVLGAWAARLVQALVRRVLEKRKLEATLTTFITNLTYMVLMTFVIIASLNQIGIQTASLVAVIGAAGLAIGLALQGSLSNFAAGFLLILFRPFRKGDFIEGAGTSGIVDEIQVFTTVLKTPDNKRVIIPNSKLTGDNIVNFSAHETRRLDLKCGVSYSDNLDKVRSVLDRLVREEVRILKDPAPVIAVSELGDNSVNFLIRVWVNTVDFGPVSLDFMEKIKKGFDAEGITIPFPQRDVHLYQRS